MSSLLERRRIPLLLGLLVFASLIFRLYISSECSLWYDEITSTRGQAEKPWGRVLAGPVREYPPLFFIISKLGLSLLGPTPLGIRLFSLFFGCVLLLAAYALSRELGLSEERSLLAVVALSLCPFFLRHAVEGRHYSMMMALLTLAATFALRLLKDPTRVGSLAGFAVSGSLGAGSHYFAVPYVCVLVGVVVLGWASARERPRLTPRQWAHVGVGLGVPTLVLLRLLWSAVALQRWYATKEQPAPAMNTDLARSILTSFSFLEHPVWAFGVQPALSLVGSWLLFRRLSGWARVVPLGLAFGPCLVAPFFSSGHFLAARYLAPSFVFYQLGAYVALFAAADRVAALHFAPAGYGRFPALLGRLLLALPLLLRLAQYPEGYRAGKEDYAGLQRYFRQELAHDTRLVVFTGIHGERLVLMQYPVGSPPVPLERFEPVAGIRRYLLAEFQVDDRERRSKLEALVERHFGLQPATFRALPLVPLPHSSLQEPVVARLLELPARKRRQ